MLMITKTKRKLNHKTFSTISTQKQQQQPSLFESPFHLGNITHYLRPPLPPTTTSLTGRQSKNHKPIIDYTQFNNGFHSSRSQEQITQLTVSISIGDIQRANSIIFEIERSLGYIRDKTFQTTLLEQMKKNSSPPLSIPLAQRPSNIMNLPTLNQVIHPSIFSSLLRRLLIHAIKQESIGNISQSHLLQSQLYHWLTNFKLNGKNWAQIDHHLMAAVLKGVLL